MPERFDVSLGRPKEGTKSPPNRLFLIGWIPEIVFSEWNMKARLLPAILGFGLFAFVALGFCWVVRARTNICAGREECAYNLRQVYIAMRALRSDTKLLGEWPWGDNLPAAGPVAAGSRWWLAAYAAGEIANPAVSYCPTRTHPGPARIDPPDYLGPLVSPVEIGEDEPIGACPFPHRKKNEWGCESRPYYNLILKSGELRQVPVREAASIPGWAKIGR